jgi:hypothetical protein
VRELRQPWRGSVWRLGGGRGGEEVSPASDVEADVARELRRRRGCGRGVLSESKIGTKSVTRPDTVFALIV